MPMLIFRKIHLIKPRIKSRNKQGKAFEHMVASGLKYLADNSNGNMWQMRLFDYQAFIKINANLHCIRQPGDYMALCNSRFYIIECKSSQMPRYFLKNVKPHQEDSMQTIERAGGYAWLLIMHRDVTGERNHKIYALNYKGWMAVKKITEAEGKKSADWKTIEDCASYVLTRAHGVLDLSPLFTPQTQTKLKMVKGRKAAYVLMRHYLRKRDIRFILMREMPMVAFYNPEDDDVFFIVDLWFMKCWESWPKFAFDNAAYNKWCAELHARRLKFVTDLPDSNASEAVGKLRPRTEIRTDESSIKRADVYVPINFNVNPIDEFIKFIMTDASTSVIHELCHAYSGEDEDKIPAVISEFFTEKVASTLARNPLIKLNLKVKCRVNKTVEPAEQVKVDVNAG